MKYILFVLALTLINCNSEKKKSLTHNNYSINANIRGIHNNVKAIFYNMETLNPIDSTYVIGNKFNFKGYINEPIPGLIYFTDDSLKEKYPTLLFWIDTVKINITTKLRDLKVGPNGKTCWLTKNQIKGSKLNYLVSIHEKKNDSIIRKLIIEREKAKSEKEKNKISKKYKSLEQKQDSIFLMNNPNNYYSLNLVYRNRNFRTKTYINNYYKLLNSNLKNSTKGKLLKKFLEKDKISEGETFKDIWGKTIDNKIVKLSNYKNQIILLDFWTSSCPPCRKQIREEFPKLLVKFKKLKIVSFSLDSNFEMWSKASNQDKINWVNISDLKGYNSKTVIDYSLQEIPKTFIIDENGIIRKIIIGYYPGRLNKELEKIFSREE